MQPTENRDANWPVTKPAMLVQGSRTANVLRGLTGKRLYGALSVSDVVIPAILFTPEQWENLFGTANFAHGPLPLLLIVLHCLAWTWERNTVKYPLVLLLNFVTMYTGFHLFLGVLTSIVLILAYWASTPEARLPRTYFLGFLIVSRLSLRAFFLDYTFHADLDCFSFPLRSPTTYLCDYK